MTTPFCTTRPKVNISRYTREERAEFVKQNPGRRHRLKLIECGKCGAGMFKGHKAAAICPGKLEFRPPTMKCRRFGVRVCPKCWTDRPATEAAAPRVKIGKAGTYAAECRSGGF